MRVLTPKERAALRLLNRKNGVTTRLHSAARVEVRKQEAAVSHAAAQQWFDPAIQALQAQNVFPAKLTPGATVGSLDLITVVSRSVAKTRLSSPPKLTSQKQKNGSKADAAALLLKTFGVPILDDSTGRPNAILAAAKTASALGILKMEDSNRAVTWSELAVMITRIRQIAQQ
jgi:hypothetical protein